MKRMYEDFLLVITLLGITWLVGLWFWFLPFLLLAPLLIIRSIDNPLPYVSLLAITSEFFSTAPFGIVLLIVILPLLVTRLLPSVLPDISFAYLLLVLVIVAIQLLVLFLPDAWSLFASGLDFTGSRLLTGDRLPWNIIGVAWAMVSLTGFLGSTLIYYNKRK